MNSDEKRREKHVRQIRKLVIAFLIFSFFWMALAFYMA